jgi:hypothetical protein
VIAGLSISACGGDAGGETTGTVHEEVSVCAGPNTTPGIDVSHWEGTVDWVKVKSSGQRFGFVKATQGTYLTTGRT